MPLIFVVLITSAPVYVDQYFLQTEISNPFSLQLDSVQLVNITPPIPSVSPRFGGALNIPLNITPDIANGEIGFTSNQTVVTLEPEYSNSSLVCNAFTDFVVFN